MKSYKRLKITIAILQPMTNTADMTLEDEVMILAALRWALRNPDWMSAKVVCERIGRDHHTYSAGFKRSILFELAGFQNSIARFISRLPR